MCHPSQNPSFAAGVFSGAITQNWQALSVVGNEISLGATITLTGGRDFVPTSVKVNGSPCVILSG